MLLVVPHVFVSEASAQAVLPPIIITETRLRPACTGSACSSLLNQLSLEFAQKYRPERGEPPEAAEISQEEFCTRLAQKKPSGCGRTRPAIPGRDGVGGNGCGSGLLSNIFANLAASVGGIANFSGDRDEPTRGFSFRASCNAHDACYASQSGRQSCDTTFNDSLFSVCGTNQDCRSAAATYGALVIRFGEQPYAASAEALQCYKWHADMDSTGCGSKKSAMTDIEWQE